jgi:hypothetical protein
MGRQQGQRVHRPLFIAVLPYIEQDAIGQRFSGGGMLPFNLSIPIYTSPADNTVATTGYPVSYACNGSLFFEKRTIAGVPDGTSNTLAFGEMYSQCGSPTLVRGNFNSRSGTAAAVFAHPNSTAAARIGRSNRPDGSASNPWGPGFNAVAVDALAGAVAPPFQVQPVHPAPVADGGCDPTRLQAHHPGGMLVGLTDGSVRSLSAGISPATFWAAVSPAGGEAIGLD